MDGGARRRTRVVAARRHARSGCADDRLRAALHAATNGRSWSFAIPSGSRACSPTTGRPVQLIFAGKAHPADEAGKHHLQRIFRARARSEVRRPHRVRRRLRPARRAFAGPGLRRLAEHAAQAARGQRHERHESVNERRAAPQHRRRLVGGGFTGDNGWMIAGDRASADNDDVLMPPTPTRCTGCSSTRSSRPSTNATRAGAAPLDRAWSSRRSSR